MQKGLLALSVIACISGWSMVAQAATTQEKMGVAMQNCAQISFEVARSIRMPAVRQTFLDSCMKGAEESGDPSTYRTRKGNFEDRMSVIPKDDKTRVMLFETGWAFYKMGYKWAGGVIPPDAVSE